MFTKLSSFLRKFRVLISNSESWIQDSGKYAYSLMLIQKSITPDNLNLSQLGFKVYSQWEEDGILFYLSQEVLSSKPRILELGSGNFLESNSRFLCEYLNAAAFLVDARKDLDAGIDKSGLRWKTHIEGLCTWIDHENIHVIQKRAQSFLGKIDIVSIDLDGQDYWILKEIDLDTVRIVVVEYNPLFGSKACVTVQKNKEFFRSKSSHNLLWGASIMAYVVYLESKGFEFVGSNVVGNNAFFVRNLDLDKLRFRMPNTDYLEHETDYLIRESVDNLGNLSYLSKQEALAKIKYEMVYNLTLHKEVMLTECMEQSEL